MIYDLEKLDATNIYHMMAQTVIPRPIAWIVTQDEKEIVNIAPFSFFTPLSSSPATVIVSIGSKSTGEKKDTLTNILNTKKCIICMVDEHNLEKMHFSSKELSSSISEAKEFNIKTTVKFDGFPPIIENTSVAYCCTFNQIVNLGESPRTLPVVLNVEQIYINDEVLSTPAKPKINFNPVARVAREYAFLGENISAPKIP
ncbi:MAG TPA: flavin reductase family protein [Arcobacter sp.]|nr:flavin reductase family protein [Arcobacter sp.]